MIEDYLPIAIETVSAWDLPDDEFAEAVNAQARLMSGLSSEYAIQESSPTPYTPLQF